MGGNTGTTISFTCVDISALTKGAYNSLTLFHDNNLQRFIIQLVQADSPAFLSTRYSQVTKALQNLLPVSAKALDGLACPEINGIDTSQYDKYPGYKKARGGSEEIQTNSILDP